METCDRPYIVISGNQQQYHSKLQRQINSVNQANLSVRQVRTKGKIWDLRMHEKN